MGRGRMALALAITGSTCTSASAEESRSSDILEVMAWCKESHDGMDWGQVLRIAKTECQDNDEENGLLRIRCSDVGLAFVLEAARTILEFSNNRNIACANGLAFVMAVALVYGRAAFDRRDAMRAQAMLWHALQDNFMMDATIWPVKTHDILDLFDAFPATFDFTPVESNGLDGVTFVIPRCPGALLRAIRDNFPDVGLVASIDEGGEEEASRSPFHWALFRDAWDQPTGTVLNEMLRQVETPFSLVVIGSALPRGPEDVETMVNVLSRRRVAAVAGPIVDSQRIYSDFCHRVFLRHYKLSFDSVYEHSLIFDEESAASIRGSWFREEAPSDKEGPCKLCDTLPPTFLVRSEVLYAMRFHPVLDGEWAVLDFWVRLSRAPLAELREPHEATSIQERRRIALPGWRHGRAPLALCPFVQVREGDVLGGPHLYGRRDVPGNGVPPAMPWFSDDAASLGPTSGRAGVPVLRPSRQFAYFMEANHLRQFLGPEGVARYTGCTLATTNCAVPNWVYRGWAAPPCCKETMRHLLFYIGDVFREMGVRYIITDGVLLGSYKFGGMLDWDADVDLHIHDDDFDRLEAEVQHRVAKDGHFLRKHVNNNSWLLQANDHNYLLIELNKRSEPWDPEKVWQLPVEGRLFPAMEDSHLNLSSWYGMSFFKHRLRHVPEWEEQLRPMYCATPYHYNCVDETQVPSGRDCQDAGIC